MREETTTATAARAGADWTALRQSEEEVRIGRHNAADLLHGSFIALPTTFLPMPSCCSAREILPSGEISRRLQHFHI